MIVMRSNHSCYKIEIGIVQIKMFDKLVRKLEEDRFMPVIKKCLIFVGAPKPEAKSLRFP